MQQTSAEGLLVIDDGKGVVSDAIYEQCTVDKLTAEDGTVFDGIIYLGCATLNAPKSDQEIYRSMHTLYEQTLTRSPSSANSRRHSLTANPEPPANPPTGNIPLDALDDPAELDALIHVALSIPFHPTGCVRVLDVANRYVETKSFPVSRILLCRKGQSDQPIACCLAIVSAVGEKETQMFQSHVFRAKLPDAVTKIMKHLHDCFQRGLPDTYLLSRSRLNELPQELCFQFCVSLDIKEEDGKGAWASCSRDKEAFKLHQSAQKRVAITVRQIALGWTPSPGQPAEDHNSAAPSLGPPHVQLRIERCFGILLSAGRNLRNSDLHLLDGLQMNSYFCGPNGEPIDAGVQGVSIANVGGELSGGPQANAHQMFTANCEWDPTRSEFELLNVETGKNGKVFMTVAIDLVISGIKEPVRFSVETTARILAPGERSWNLLANNKRPLTEQFYVRVAKEPNVTSVQKLYHVTDIQSEGRLRLLKQSVTPGSQSANASQSSGLFHWFIQSPSQARDLTDQLQCADSPPSNADRASNDGGSCMSVETDSDDEPLVSGTGLVSKEIDDEKLLVDWRDAIKRWHQKLNERPKNVASLIKRAGVPEALRAEVWMLLVDSVPESVRSKEVESQTSTSVSADNLMDLYRILVAKETCECETVIVNDISRTYPGHEFFKNSDGQGQDALFKLCKAYALYDPEVAYCQGLSFIAATLLLHMPEEQAFVVLVRLMYDFGLREMFRNEFDALHERFYVLDQLLKEYYPDVFIHFGDIGVHSHMYASQWFLTMFTAKFPLNLVYQIIDLVLCFGLDVLYNVSLALIQMSRSELLCFDMEGVMKHFRVQMPKKFHRSPANCQQLVSSAFRQKFSQQKLRRLAREYRQPRQSRMDAQNTITLLKAENREYQMKCFNMEAELDAIQWKLTSDEVVMQRERDLMDNDMKLMSRDLMACKNQLVDSQDLHSKLKFENDQLKEMLRAERDQWQADLARRETVIKEYRQITNQQSSRYELKSEELVQHQKEAEALRKQLCDQCAPLAAAALRCLKTNDASSQLTANDESAVAFSTNGAHVDTGDVATIRSLELQLAEAKLRLTESECERQEMEHALAQVRARQVDESGGADLYGPYAWLNRRNSHNTPVAGGLRVAVRPSPSLSALGSAPPSHPDPSESSLANSNPAPATGGWFQRTLLSFRDSVSTASPPLASAPPPTSRAGHVS